MKKWVLPIAIAAVAVLAAAYFVKRTAIGASSYAYVRGELFTREGIINWILAVASLFFLLSVVSLVFTLGNQQRRRGRNEVRLLLAKRSYGASLAAKTCGDAILNAVIHRTFPQLSDLPIARLVIDHLADHSFNVKLHEYMYFRLKTENVRIAADDLIQLIGAIESWKTQREAVTATLRCYVERYAGVEIEKEYKRAMYFLRRREKYFDGVFDVFVVDVKDITISALSHHLNGDVGSPVLAA